MNDKGILLDIEETDFNHEEIIAIRKESDSKPKPK
jgi:hypothetical protein